MGFVRSLAFCSGRSVGRSVGRSISSPTRDSFAPPPDAEHLWPSKEELIAKRLPASKREPLLESSTHRDSVWRSWRVGKKNPAPGLPKEQGTHRSIPRLVSCLVLALRRSTLVIGAVSCPLGLNTLGVYLGRQVAVREREKKDKTHQEGGVRVLCSKRMTGTGNK